MFACRFIVVHAHFIAYVNTLKQSLSFMISLQKLHAHFHVCLVVLICKLLWHQPCTNSVMSEVLMDYGICKSTADVQLFSYINDSNLSVLLNQNINLFNIVHCLWSDGLNSLHQWHLWGLSTHWYTFLCIILYCVHILLWISEGFTPLTTKNEWQHVSQQWCNPKVDLTCLHYNCTNVTECNIATPWHA
jgi:hypothetical protein